MAEWWPGQLTDPFVGDFYEQDQPIQSENTQWQSQETEMSTCGDLANTAPSWQARLANQAEHEPWSSQIADSSGCHSPEGMSPNEPFPDLPDDMPDTAFPYGSGQTTAKPSPRHSPSREASFAGYNSGEATARPSRCQSPTQELGLSSMAGRLGLGWPRNLHPLVSRPWHYQHPSVVDNHYLLSTCDRLESIFPKSPDTFVPRNVPWFSHWMIAFWGLKTTLTRVECCMVFRYKYRDVIPGIEHMKQQHVVELWNYLSQGEHEYAFEWGRDEGFEDSLKTLLDVWISEACRPREWQKEEKRFRHQSMLNGADF